MKFKRKNAELLRKVLDRWVADGLLSPGKGEALRSSISEIPFNWHGITRAAFTIALVSGLASFAYLLADKLLLELFYKIINAPYPLLTIIFGVLAGAGYYFTWRRAGRRPRGDYSNEALMLGSGALAGASLFFLGRSVSPGLEHYAPLFLIGSILWLALGRLLPSPSTWVVGCLCLIIWFGTETAYFNGDSSYFLGMNLPLRLFLFSVPLILLSFHLRRLEWPSFYAESFFVLAVMTFFVSLWFLSIFGNFGDWDSWQDASEWVFVPYSLLLAALSGLAVYLGSRWDDSYLKGIGILFFLLNIYTKYFEHGWPRMHGALFFLVLALSFWFIGRRAEKLWEITGD